MKISRNHLYVGALAALFAVLAGCGGSGSDPVNGVGSISLGISDGPISGASKVCITFNEIEFKGEGPSTVVTLDPPEKINLLEFQGENAYPILVGQELPAGQYQWMRLGVDAVKGSNGGLGDTGGEGCDGESSYIVMDDGTFNLYVPSGANTGLKLVGGLTVPVNATANFTAEFDVKKSITAPDGLSPDVILRPTVRLVNNVDVGTLTGQVHNDLAAPEGAACDPWVYVFDDGILPNAIAGMDEEPDPNDPVATAMVKSEVTAEGVTEYRYTVGFLLAGNYEAAFTCNGADFEPVDGKSAPIEANVVTTVDFLPE